MDVFDDGGFGFNTTDNTTLTDYTHDANINLGGTAETSFSNPRGGAERPIDSLYDKKIRDGSTFDATADVYSTDGTSVSSLPDPPIITPSFRPGDNIVNLQDEIAAAELAAAKTALVDKFYQSIEEDYGLPLPEKIPYDQFEVGRDGKKLYWTPEEGIVISVINTRGGGFLTLSTLASKYGNGGTVAIRTSMGLEEYTNKTRKTGELSSKGKKNVQQAYDILPSEDADITPVVADHALASVEIATKALDEELTPEQSAALETIDDPPLDLHALASGLACEDEFDGICEGA
ncbi:hypothetical protein RRG08_003242 [Elysia crispata]|uniref:Uncharacterized protein n=1 Tax=Elysia crispata TaxID=231223 RepID=A0AAE1AYP8_9GAST|nr:hypothetical protein RRG08_003242 [Elysia crispata]